jgi:hypothetical protein
LSQVNILASPARFKKLLQFNFWFPWPLSNRECILEFSGYPVAEEQGIIIMMRSPKNKYMNQELPEIPEGSIRMSVPIGCLFVQYISSEYTKVSILVQANACAIHSDLVPEWLLNFGQKQMMYFLMDSLRQNVVNFYGSEYENRVRADTGFYTFVRKVLSTDIDIS